MAKLSSMIKSGGRSSRSSGMPHHKSSVGFPTNKNSKLTVGRAPSQRAYSGLKSKGRL